MNLTKGFFVGDNLLITRGAECKIKREGLSEAGIEGNESGNEAGDKLWSESEIKFLS